MRRYGRGSRRSVPYGGILRATLQATTAAAMLSQQQTLSMTLGGLTMLLSILQEFGSGGDRCGHAQRW